MGKTPYIKKLEGVIQGLERELDQLAPSPGLISPLSNNFKQRAKPYFQSLPRRQSLERRLFLCRRRLAFFRIQPVSGTLELAA